jgi:hypothetical protein
MGPESATERRSCNPIHGRARPATELPVAAGAMALTFGLYSRSLALGDAETLALSLV